MLNTDWKKEYELDLPEIDIQHIRFLQLIKNIEKAEDSMLGTLMEELYLYARFHFISEEALMLLHSYPRLQEHQQEHEQVLGKVQLYRHLIDEDPRKKGELLIFLIQWFSGHTTGTDQYLGDFILQRRKKTG